MKSLFHGIVRVLPVVLERSAFQIVLHGWPAAAAIGFVGATIVATVVVLSGNHGDHPAE